MFEAGNYKNDSYIELKKLLALYCAATATDIEMRDIEGNIVISVVSDDVIHSDSAQPHTGIINVTMMEKIRTGKGIETFLEGGRFVLVSQVEIGENTYITAVADTINSCKTSIGEESVSPEKASTDTLRSGLGFVSELLKTFYLKDKRASEELNNLFKSILDTSNDAVFIGTEDNLIINCNKAAIDIFGYEKEELLCFSLQDIIPDFTQDILDRDVLCNGIILEGFNVRKNGEKFPVVVNVRSKSNKEDDFIVIYIRDVTREKNAEAELANERERFNSLMNTIPDHIYFKDSESRFTEVNKALAKKMGVEDPFGATGKTDSDIFGEEHSQKTLQDEKRIIETGEGIIGIEEKENWRDGEITWSSTTKMPLKNLKGKIIGTFGISRNITEKKKIEEKLRYSEERFRLVFQTSPDSINVNRLSDGVYADINEGFTAMTGYTKEDVLGKSSLDLKIWVDEDDRKKLVEGLRTNGHVNNLEARFRRKDGVIVMASMSAKIVMLNSEPHIISITRDMEAYNKVLNDLKKSEEKFAKAFHNSPSLIMISALEDGCIIDANQTFLSSTGFTREEIIGHTSIDLKIWKEPEDRQKIIGRFLVNGNVKNYETMMRKKDGLSFPILVSAENIDIAGKSAIISVITDITERKKAETALSEEKERLAVTLASIGDAVIATDSGGQITLMNKIAEDLTGWKFSDSAGKNLTEIFRIINEKNREICENPVKKVLESGEIIGLANHTVLISLDGTERIIADSGAPIKDSNGNIIGVVLVFRDITEKEKLEQELQKAQKLESIGILAGGIAHDFNNLLTGILGNISLAKLMTKTDTEISNLLNSAEDDTLRAKDLTMQLLTFSKGGSPIKKQASIGSILIKTAGLALRGSNIKPEFSIPDNLWDVEFDESQMSQAFNNIIINSVQAMTNGGVIKICAENFVSTEDLCFLTQKGRYVRISIHDNGVGIPCKFLDKIFDPFFTTKEIGHGLGLATTYSIIKKHDGYIVAESEPGKGATFMIYLHASVLKEDLKTDLKKSLSYGKKILLMDDEPSVINATGKILKYLGYVVECASDGAQALEKYKQALDSGNPFDLVIMDLTIPGGIGGIEAVRILKKIDSNAKAIVSSGYSNDPAMSNFMDYGFSGVASKPYRIDELKAIIYNVLSGGQTV